MGVMLGVKVSVGVALGVGVRVMVGVELGVRLGPRVALGCGGRGEAVGAGVASCARAADDAAVCAGRPACANGEASLQEARPSSAPSKTRYFIKRRMFLNMVIMTRQLSLWFIGRHFGRHPELVEG